MRRRGRPEVHCRRRLAKVGSVLISRGLGRPGARARGVRSESGSLLLLRGWRGRIWGRQPCQKPAGAAARGWHPRLSRDARRATRHHRDRRRLLRRRRNRPGANLGGRPSLSAKGPRHCGQAPASGRAPAFKFPAHTPWGRGECRVRLGARGGRAGQLRAAGLRTPDSASVEGHCTEERP